jgi:hypothetical protein
MLSACDSSFPEDDYGSSVQLVSRGSRSVSTQIFQTLDWRTTVLTARLNDFAAEEKRLFVLPYPAAARWLKIDVRTQARSVRDPHSCSFKLGRRDGRIIHPTVMMGGHIAPVTLDRKVELDRTKFDPHALNAKADETILSALLYKLESGRDERASYVAVDIAPVYEPLPRSDIDCEIQFALYGDNEQPSLAVQNPLTGSTFQSPLASHSNNAEVSSETPYGDEWGFVEIPFEGWQLSPLARRGRREFPLASPTDVKTIKLEAIRTRGMCKGHVWDVQVRENNTGKWIRVEPRANDPGEYGDSETKAHFIEQQIFHVLSEGAVTADRVMLSMSTLIGRSDDYDHCRYRLYLSGEDEKLTLTERLMEKVMPVRAASAQEQALQRNDPAIPKGGPRVWGHELHDPLLTDGFYLAAERPFHPEFTGIHLYARYERSELRELFLVHGRSELLERGRDLRRLPLFRQKRSEPRKSFAWLSCSAPADDELKFAGALPVKAVCVCSAAHCGSSDANLAVDVFGDASIRTRYLGTAKYQRFTLRMLARVRPESLQ